MIEFIVIMFKWFCFLFLKWHAGRSCQGNWLFWLASRDYGTTTRRLRVDLDNCLAGRIFSLLVVRFDTLAPKNTKSKVHARRQRSQVNIELFLLTFTCLVAYTSTAMPLDHSWVEINHWWRHSYITWHYLTFYISFEISTPCTKINSRKRLYNAAASPASRLRSAGSLAINSIC